MAHLPDSELIRSTRNTERFFVENRSVSWVLLIGVLVWGVLGYARMPKRKDPEIPVREAVAICPWPGVDAKKVEQLVTRRIEEKIAGNSYIHPAGPGTNFGIRSVTLDGMAMVYVQLAETVTDPEKQFDDINVKLNTLVDLPQGAGPIQFESDFGDTSALMLTVASPKVGEVELALRAREIRSAIERTRETAVRWRPRTTRLSSHVCSPKPLAPTTLYVRVTASPSFSLPAASLLTSVPSMAMASPALMPMLQTRRIF